MRADILAHMPATLTFLVRRRLDHQLIAVAALHGRLGGDENELEIIAQRGQQVVLLASGLHGHFRLQPENDAYAPIIVDELVVLGRVKFVIRQYY
jgi:hypothetical protein